jgi:hypothetical protein
MKKLLLFLPLSLLMSTFFYAQKVIKITNKAPLSIYAFNSLEKNNFSISLLNKRLQLKSFNSIIINIHNVDQKIYPLNFMEIGERTSTSVYDGYESYQNNNFLKEFLFDNNPTRWNLQCVENRIQPHSLNE